MLFPYLMKFSFASDIYPLEFPVNDECREADGLWSCTDCDKCLTLDGCSEYDALYRSGHLCHTWPWYNGGAPILPTVYSTYEIKHMTCLQSRNKN
jgi:hypothetical protein